MLWMDEEWERKRKSRTIKKIEFHDLPNAVRPMEGYRVS